MNDAKRFLDAIFGERITMDLKAGKTIDFCREMKMSDSDIVEKYLDCLDVSIGLLDLGYQGDCQSIIEANKKAIKQDILVIASLAFENILG
jgi:hypothetical protein